MDFWVINRVWWIRLCYFTSIWVGQNVHISPKIESVELGFYVWKLSSTNSVFIGLDFTVDRTKNSKQSLSKLSKQIVSLIPSHSQSLTLTLTLAHSHSSFHLTLSLHLAPSLRLAPSPFLWLRRRPCISFILSCPLAPSSLPSSPLPSPSLLLLLSQEWPSGNDFYPNNRRVSFSFDLFYVVSGFLYHCMNDCLDCLCVLEKWVVVVGFAYLLFLLFFFFFFWV